MSDWVVTPQPVMDYSGDKTVTLGGSTHTKGVWKEMIESTGIDSSFIQIKINATSTGGTYGLSTLFDVGIGVDGSEVTLINNLQAEVSYSSRTNATVYEFPISIPKGSRVVLRGQSAVVDPDLTIHAEIACSSKAYEPSLARVHTFGANVADSNGQPLIAASWVQLTAGIDVDLKCIQLALCNSLDNTRSTEDYNLHIGIGPNASEVAIISNIYASSSSTNDSVSGSPSLLFPVFIPKNTRISVKIDSTADMVDAILYGVS